VAITTYAELQSAVADWLNRGDLTSRIPDFIALAEADINSVFDLRTVEQDTTLTVVTGSRTVALPAGFRDTLNLWPIGPVGRLDPLRFVLPELLDTITINSVPRAWCVDGSNIAFDCPNDGTYPTYDLRYRSGLGLSDAQPTNLVLTNYPNVYLFGAMKEASPFLRDPEAMAIWEGKYGDAIAKAKAKESRNKSLVTLNTEPGILTNMGRRSGFNIYAGR
jgi:hypothetical protein